MTSTLTVARLAGAVAWLGSSGCGFNGAELPDRPYPCGEGVQTCARVDAVGLHSAEWDFESGCLGASCQERVTGDGGVSIGASFHPGARALHVRGGGHAEMPFSLHGFSDGARVAMNVRCDEGVELDVSVTGERLGTVGAVRIPARTVWTRVERVMAEPRETLPDVDSARTGTTEVTMSLAVSGSGECVIDRLLYTGTVRACVEHSYVYRTCVGDPNAQDASFPQ
jgi:hypothetical protein